MRTDSAKANQIQLRSNVSYITSFTQPRLLRWYLGLHYNETHGY